MMMHVCMYVCVGCQQSHVAGDSVLIFSLSFLRLTSLLLLLSFPHIHTHTHFLVSQGAPLLASSRAGDARLPPPPTLFPSSCSPPPRESGIPVTLIRVEAESRKAREERNQSQTVATHAFLVNMSRQSVPEMTLSASKHADNHT